MSSSCTSMLFLLPRRLLDQLRTENALPGTDRPVPGSLLRDVRAKLAAAAGFQTALVQGSSSKGTSVDDMGGLAPWLPRPLDQHTYQVHIDVASTMGNEDEHLVAGYFGVNRRIPHFYPFLASSCHHDGFCQI